MSSDPVGAATPERALWPYVLAMAAVVVCSNVLVQYPVEAVLVLGDWGLDLAEYLTWGAFTYPVCFLVTDLANRRHGPSSARRVVAVGFVLAVGLSVWLADARIAVASGTAFVCAQLLDIAVFDRLRRSSWWKAPLVSSAAGSVLDTYLFFGLAFAGTGLDWFRLGSGDLVFKLLVAVLLLVPFRLLAADPRPRAVGT